MKNLVVDDRTIQRLVDNRLPEADRAAVLLAAEQDPEIWRRVAMAFVEEQVWSSAIPLAMKVPVLDRVSDVSKQKTKTISAGGSMYRSPWLLALASLLLVAVTVGICMLVNPPATGSSGESSSVAESPVTGEPWFLDVGGDQVPLYESTAPIRDYMASGADQNMLERLWENGLDVQPDTRYITGTGSDGRAFVVPVRQYRLRPRFQ